MLIDLCWVFLLELDHHFFRELVTLRCFAKSYIGGRKGSGAINSKNCSRQRGRCNSDLVLLINWWWTISQKFCTSIELYDFWNILNLVMATEIRWFIRKNARVGLRSSAALLLPPSFPVTSRLFTHSAPLHPPPPPPPSTSTSTFTPLIPSHPPPPSLSYCHFHTVTFTLMFSHFEVSMKVKHRKWSLPDCSLTPLPSHPPSLHRNLHLAANVNF